MKKALPLILIAGAAILLLSMRKRKKVSVEAGPTETITEAEFAAGPSLLDKATDVVKNVFSKSAQQKRAKQAQALAIKRAKAKGIKTSQAKAVTQALVKPAFFRGIDDDSVLC
jgi:hypothetical protein